MKLQQIPADVLDACREREHSDETIESMSVQELFTEYCEWHGIIGWAGSLMKNLIGLLKANGNLETDP